MAEADVNGVRLYYEEAGDGVPFVALHDDKLGRFSAPTLIPDSELVWFDESAHCPQLDEPDGFFDAIRDWLTRHPVRT